MSNTQTFNVEGMSCNHCVETIKRSVGSLPGISKVEVDLMGKTVKVVYDDGKLESGAIREAIEEVVFDVIN